MIKEEILKRHDVIIPDKDDILHTLMDEYAKEITMDFCRWVMGRIDVIYRPTGNDTWEGVRPSIKPMKDEIITDTELFNLYLNHISKTTKE